MLKSIVFILSAILLITVLLEAEEVNMQSKKNDTEIKMIPAIYIETKQQDGTFKEENLVLTNESKNILNKSLEGIISLFEETAKALREKKSDFGISEVEIYASLQGEASAWVLKGATEASFKIILHPVKKNK